MTDRFVAPEQRAWVKRTRDDTTVSLSVTLPCAANGRRLIRTQALSLTVEEALAWAAELTAAAKLLTDDIDSSATPRPEL